MPESFETELTLKDYVAVFKRRFGLFFWVTAPILTIGTALAFGLPPVYESLGTILIEQQEVPEYLVRSTVTSYPDERIRVISQRVMTRDRLTEIIDRYKVYPDAEPSDAVSELRQSVTLGSVQSEVNDSALGTEMITMAFTVGFKHSSPVMARDVAGELVSLFLQENQRVRERAATETREFLAKEGRRLEGEIRDMEARLADFKRRNADTLPDLASLNLASIERTDRDLEAAEREIRTLREQRNLLQSELSQLSPYDVVLDDDGKRILSSQDRLKLLERTLIQQSAIYSQDHPDVLKTKREIAALRAQNQVAPAVDRDALLTELSARNDELAAARQKYSADHPDVRKLERIIANLEATIDSTPAAAPTSAPAPDNPAYIQRQVQAEATQIELDAALQRRQQLQAKLAELEGRMAQTPQVEQEYSALQRGYDQLVSQYNQIDQKQQDAEIALNLESESKGERFTLIEAPGVPALPSDPNRIAILLLSIVVAFAVAAGTVAVAEISDTTVRNARDVSSLLEIPPLAAIPHINNAADNRSHRFRQLLTATAVCLWIAVTVALAVVPPFSR